ncbi:MAG: transcription factor [Geobacter sp.]|nr:MAG: transcription factor [Geobacter sp.]
MFSKIKKLNEFRPVSAMLLVPLLLLIMPWNIAAGQPLDIRANGRVPVTILSIIPSQAEPGMSVTLYGSGFNDATHVLIGPMEAQTNVLGPKQLSFEIPDLAPGLYGLFVRRDDGAVSKGYRFSITPRTPSVTSLTPDKIFACTTNEEREVVISGSNFLRSSQVLFDGAVIKSRFESSEAIAIHIPRIAGGLHTVQVKNPGGTLSSSLALFIDSKPEITGIIQGENYVNYYDLIIEGRNLQSSSKVVVEGKSMTASAVNPVEREKVIYVDCNRIIYQRHPYDSAEKSFTVQVINPNGESSEVIQVSAP